MKYFENNYNFKLFLCSTDAIPNSNDTILTCTDAIPPQSWIASTVLMLSPQYWTASIVLMAIPLQYWSYPPHVLMLSHTCTAAIPLQYWCYSSTVLMLSPTVLNSLHSTDVILPHVLMLSPHNTEQPLQYWTDVIRGGNCQSLLPASEKPMTKYTKKSEKLENVPYVFLYIVRQYMVTDVFQIYGFWEKTDINRGQGWPQNVRNICIP